MHKPLLREEAESGQELESAPYLTGNFCSNPVPSSSLAVESQQNNRRDANHSFNLLQSLCVIWKSTQTWCSLTEISLCEPMRSQNNENYCSILPPLEKQEE